MDRRGFLQSILAAAVAPAVIKVENAMRLWVPKTPEILVATSLPGDISLASWVQDAVWRHVVLVREDNDVKAFVDGVRVQSLSQSIPGLMVIEGQAMLGIGMKGGQPARDVSNVCVTVPSLLLS
jgi:hypothetical protein